MASERRDKLPEMEAVRWQCRRGMLELDMMLLPFFETQYKGLTVDEKVAFIDLLKENDQVLYQWFIGRQEPLVPALQDILQKIRLSKPF